MGAGYLWYSIRTFDIFYIRDIPSSAYDCWFRQRTTSDINQRILTHIRRAYPSVLDIDQTVIVTWDSLMHPQDSKVM